MSTLETEPTAAPTPSHNWLWPLRIPLSKITLLAGDPGLGKSFIALDIAARLSTGAPMPAQPDDPRFQIPRPPAKTLLFSAEDELHDTIHPRLSALGADLAQIIPVSCIDAQDQHFMLFSLKFHLAFLEARLREHAPKLVIFDPITSFMEGIDANSSTHVRQCLTPFVQLAARYNVAILAITHFSKETKRQLLYRAVNSLALTAVARTALVVQPAPNRPCNLLIPLKANLTASHPPIPFHITDQKIEWLPLDTPCSAAPTDRPPTQTPKPPEPDLYEQHDRQLATDYLLDALKDGPQPAIPLIKEARKLAISERTLKRAKAQLQIESQKAGMHEWHWMMPERGKTP